MGTTIYTAYVRPGSARPDREAVLIAERFSFGACAWTVLWALYHRLWLAAVVLVAVGAVLGLVFRTLDLHPLVQAATSTVLSVWVGFEGRDWQRARLIRQGWMPAGVVIAPNLKLAEQRFFAKLA